MLYGPLHCQAAVDGYEQAIEKIKAQVSLREMRLFYIIMYNYIIIIASS